jgi:hypothetical protein
LTTPPSSIVVFNVPGILLLFAVLYISKILSELSSVFISFIRSEFSGTPNAAPPVGG